MITDTTKTALKILVDIAYEKPSPECKLYALAGQDLTALLDKLEAYGLIRPLKGKPQGVLLPYVLLPPLGDITLLQMLEATGENLDCNHEVQEEMYTRYPIVARKLGVINIVTRKCLSQIRLTDFL